MLLLRKKSLLLEQCSCRPLLLVDVSPLARHEANVARARSLPLRY